MTVETQTTMQILILAVAGLVSLAIPNLAGLSNPGSTAPRHEASAGFAVFCDDRR
ncbi:MAG: hypothetical protein P8Y10_06055 [Gemmatimonadales bacterium]